MDVTTFFYSFTDFVTSFFFFFFFFIFGNVIATIAKTKKKNFSPYFGNGIATIRVSQIFFFFFSIIGNAIGTIAKNLYHLFQQWHCHNCQIFFSPVIWFSLRALTFRAPTRATEWAEGITAIPLPKIKNFSLLLFIFLSPTFVEFRQWYCRNFFSFLRLLNNLKQYL